MRFFPGLRGLGRLQWGPVDCRITRMTIADSSADFHRCSPGPHFLRRRPCFLSGGTAVPTSMRRKAEGIALPIAERTLNQLIQILKLLADPSRLRILFILAREGEMNVTSLCELLGESQPAVSHHLTMMRMANLVAFRRDGKFNYYSIDAITVGDTLDRLLAEAGRGQTLQLGDIAVTFSRTGRRR